MAQGQGEAMTITCKAHGQVEAHVDANHNAWCPQCRAEALDDWLASNPEHQRQIEHAIENALPGPMSVGSKVVVESTPHDGPRPFWDAYNKGRGG